MIRRIKTTGVKAGRIRSTSRPAERIDPALVARGLGAERVASRPASLSPRLLELRGHLFAALRSSGGRRGIEGADLRPKIPISTADWHQLEVLAKQLSSDGIAVTPGQVASQLLHAALADLRTEHRELSRGPA